MKGHPDILIVGGGVIGLTSAYYLARQGASVTVIDQGELGKQASWAGAGIIPPGNPERAATPYDRLRALSSCMFPSLSEELRERSGIDNGYVVCGGLEFPEGADPIPVEEWRGEGIAFEELDGPGLRRIEPNLALTVNNGYFLPAMAQVRNPRHLQALIRSCELCGVKTETNLKVRGLLRQGSRILGIDTEQGQREAGCVLLASGAWTDELLRQVGWQLGIQPVRGQIALLNTNQPDVRPILLKGKRYVVPRTDGRVLVGATEEDAGFDARPTAAAIAGLIDFAVAQLPTLANATIERAWAGLRPGSRDGLPYLGAVPGIEGLFVAAGHFRSGIQLSPATGMLMAELLLGKAPSLPLDDFRLDRPAALPRETAFRS